MADPDIDSPEPLRRAKQARAHSQALRNQVAEAAEAVAEAEQEAARVHQILADQGGPLAEEAREHADRAEDLAAKERAEAQQLRGRPRLNRPRSSSLSTGLVESLNPRDDAARLVG